MPTRLNIVVATALPPEALEARPEYKHPDLTLSFHGAGRNIILDWPAICEVFGCEIPPRLRDLLEIAVAVYATDVAFPRGENEAWIRSARFVVPVRDRDLWESLEPQLAEALYVLAHDAFSFDFCARAEEGEEPPAPSNAGTRPDADCVSLLSGGLDSFAGAAMLLATDRRPLFVAHRPQNPMVVASQEHVCRCLQQAFDRPVRLAAVACVPARGGHLDYPYPPPEERETSQRTRSFLYVALGALGCHAAGTDQLFCPENGVLAVNLPLTEARVGGYSTAGTRPQTLARFRGLLSALGIPLQIHNPFLYQTKGELIRDVLRRYFAPEAIQGTVSCWMAGRLSRPCGSCVPCLVRAIAMRAAGLPPEAHAVDPFSTGAEAGPGSAARANLVDLLILVGRLRRMSERELLHAYPVLLEMAPEASIPASIKMLRRFANEAAEALGEPDFAGEGEM
jgi:hypothetical protein